MRQLESHEVDSEMDSGTVLQPRSLEESRIKKHEGVRALNSARAKPYDLLTCPAAAPRSKGEI